MPVALDVYSESIRSALYAAFGATSLHPQSDVAWPNDGRALAPDAGQAFATVTIHWEHKSELDLGAPGTGQVLGSIVVQLHTPAGQSLKQAEQDMSALAAAIDWQQFGDVHIFDAIPQTLGPVGNYHVSRVSAEFEVLF